MDRENPDIALVGSVNLGGLLNAMSSCASQKAEGT
jgi:hypothetical protein